MWVGVRGGHKGKTFLLLIADPLVCLGYQQGSSSQDDKLQMEGRMLKAAKRD